MRGTTTATQVNPEADDDDGGLFDVKEQSQIAADVFLRIKRNVKLRRLMDMHTAASTRSTPRPSFVDRHTRPAQTPDDVGLTTEISVFA